MKKASAFSLVAASACSLALVLSGCGGSNESSDKSTDANQASDSKAIISVFGSEPAKPLIPSDTNEVGGGHPIGQMFSTLVRFDTKGKMVNEVAKEIKPNADMTQYRITIQDGWKFSDGTSITATSFTRAWSWAANAANAQVASDSYSEIKGFDELQQKGVAADAQLSGLKVVDDHTFTVDLNAPSSTFPVKIGNGPFAPLPDSFYKDPKAFGEKPVSNGPYKFQSWEHNKSIRLVKNPYYKGGIKVKNAGIEFRVYSDPSAAYADVQSGNLDVLDTIPSADVKTFQTDNMVQAVNTPGAVIQQFTIPSYMKHFGEGKEGKLRRQAISMSIDRKQLLDKVLGDTGTVATDFIAPTIPGSSKTLKGEDVLKYNPTKAKELWAEANKISAWSDSDTFKMAYNSDGGHKEIYDALANSIKNSLGIKAEGNPQPTFSEFRNNVTQRKFTDSAFRSGWQPDYPSPEDYLKPNYSTGAADGNGSNDGDYKNPKFDELLKKAASARSVDSANKLFQQSEEILLEDLPVVPLYNANSKGVAAKNVHGFTFNWQGIPDYPSMTK
ncbi:oligopeptide-binding protein OppA [Bifidobacterium actinocoloniiforme DSM 22766]|uniref:Oligopeptide-binding protein OppA n=2 Tax=Bifidobacterium actinocoloniiforme TaxID=638619 RepID=A0A086Z0W2_9BIFI|nr:ABC transporter substrate-binding protein [Bifidobacterium actinocoloniiforme]AKV55352.1 ABC transporter substrate-binding protein [Bifidobacterium actinocoloniiforme DSM 22766]KFI40162.1 oligopeptide-binding protein OppA [Bifidobacterium actinocoloniiforme DSM 22766]